MKSTSMHGASASDNIQGHRLIAKGVIASQLLFTLGWVLAGAFEGNGYLVAYHDISDLGHDRQ